eukprot:CFRG4054T1
MKGNSAGPMLQLLLSHQLFTDSEECDADTVASVVDLLNIHRLVEQSTSTSSSLKKWIAKIVSLLRSTTDSKRWTGLCLLGPTARQSSPEVFDSNCIVWMSCVLDLFKRNPSERLQSHAVSVFLELLAVGVTKPELRRALSDSHFPRFVQHMLALAQVKTTKATKKIHTVIPNVASQASSISLGLTSLARCLELQPGPARPFVNQIFASAVVRLDSTHDDVVKAATTCIANTSLAGKAGSTPQEQWTVLLRNTISSIHQVLDVGFNVLDEVDPVSVNDNSHGVGLPLPELSAGTITSTHLLAKACVKRFTALCTLVENMLQRNILSKQGVPAALIFKLLTRVCEVDDYTPTRYGADAAYDLLVCFLPQYHEAVLRLTTAVCKTLGTQLLPFVSQVSYVIGSMLKTYKHKPGMQYGPVQVLVLHSYVSAVECLGIGIDKAVTDSVVNSVLKGISTMPETSGTNANTFLDQMPSTSSAQTMSWWRVAMATLTIVLSNLNTQLSHERMNELEAWTCMQLATYQVSPTIALVLLLQPECRLSLYRVLRAVTLNTAPEHSSYIQQAMRIFLKGVVDTDPSVSTYCRECSAMCDWLIHPRLPVARRAVAGVLSNGLISASTVKKSVSTNSDFGDDDEHVVDPPFPITATVNSPAVVQTLYRTLHKPHAVSSKRTREDTVHSGVNEGLTEQPRRSRPSPGANTAAVPVETVGLHHVPTASPSPATIEAPAPISNQNDISTPITTITSASQATISSSKQDVPAESKPTVSTHQNENNVSLDDDDDSDDEDIPDIIDEEPDSE